MEMMLRLLAYGAAGNPLPAEINTFKLGDVIAFAAEQGVWQLCFAGIKQAVQEQKISIAQEDAELYETLKKRFVADFRATQNRRN